MNLNFERERLWFEIVIEDGIAYADIGGILLGRRFYKHLSPLMTCPDCNGHGWFDRWIDPYGHCPVCHEEGLVGPLCWLDYKLRGWIDDIMLPFIRWINRPTDEYICSLDDAQHRQRVAQTE